MSHDPYDGTAEVDKLSKINSAGLINLTLENLFKEAYYYLVQGDFVKWNRKLDSIWCILGGDVEPNAEDEKNFLKLEEQLYATGPLGKKTLGFKKAGDDLKNSSAQQYLILRNKSLFLRRLQNKQGKGTAYYDSSDDDFE
jgi:hypothetical protein